MREPTPTPADHRIIELAVRNHPGVMVHVANLFARRGFNLEGILCGPLADGRESRMLLLVGAEARLDQVIRQLEKLHDVLEVRQRPDLEATIFDLESLSAPGSSPTDRTNPAGPLAQKSTAGLA